jgi:hypothetical protein
MEPLWSVVRFHGTPLFPSGERRGGDMKPTSRISRGHFPAFPRTHGVYILRIACQIPFPSILDRPKLARDSSQRLQGRAGKVHMADAPGGSWIRYRRRLIGSRCAYSGETSCVVYDVSRLHAPRSCAIIYITPQREHCREGLDLLLRSTPLYTSVGTSGLSTSSVAPFISPSG